MNFLPFYVFIILPLLSFSQHIPKTIDQLIQDQGFQVIHHSATTSDGFVLSIQEIKPVVAQPRAVVYLQHGLFASSASFCIQDALHSLPFILTNAGYHVFLGNARASDYAMKNIKYSNDTKQFWDWDLGTEGLLDIPLQIDTILEIAKADSLYYIGHSQGTASAFFMFTHPVLGPKYSQKVRLFTALAPIFHVHHIRQIVLKTLSYLDFEAILEQMGDKGFGGGASDLHKYMPEICRIWPEFCEEAVEIWFGPSDHWNTTLLPIEMEFQPGGATSIRNLATYAQNIVDNKFCQCNFPTVEQNIQHYGKTTPPCADISRIQVPTAFFHGGNDYLADTQDVDLLLSQFPQHLKRFTKFIPSYNHGDFLFAYNARETVYQDILSLLEKY